MSLTSTVVEFPAVDPPFLPRALGVSPVRIHEVVRRARESHSIVLDFCDHGLLQLASNPRAIATQLTQIEAQVDKAIVDLEMVHVAATESNAWKFAIPTMKKDTYRFLSGKVSDMNSKERAIADHAFFDLFPCFSVSRTTGFPDALLQFFQRCTRSLRSTKGLMAAIISSIPVFGGGEGLETADGMGGDGSNPATGEDELLLLDPSGLHRVVVELEARMESILNNMLTVEFPVSALTEDSPEVDMASASDFSAKSGSALSSPVCTPRTSVAPIPIDFPTSATTPASEIPNVPNVIGSGTTSPPTMTISRRRIPVPSKLGRTVREELERISRDIGAALFSHSLLQGAPQGSMFGGDGSGSRQIEDLGRRLHSIKDTMCVCVASGNEEPSDELGHAVVLLRQYDQSLVQQVISMTSTEVSEARARSAIEQLSVLRLDVVQLIARVETTIQATYCKGTESVPNTPSSSVKSSIFSGALSEEVAQAPSVPEHATALLLNARNLADNIGEFLKSVHAIARDFLRSPSSSGAWAIGGSGEQKVFNADFGRPSSQPQVHSPTPSGPPVAVKPKTTTPAGDAPEPGFLSRWLQDKANEMRINARQKKLRATQDELFEL